MMKLQLAPNPVLVKELRGRMRGARAYVFLTAFLLLMGIVSYGLYRIIVGLATPAAFNGGGPSASVIGPLIGQCLFVSLVFLALIGVCVITPSLTAGAISNEHERKTFELLVATPLRPASILFGKLLAALSYIGLIILSAAPLVSLSYVFGGVPLRDMLQAMLLLLGFATTFGVIGLFFSTWFRRTGPAVTASYVVVALFVFGTAFFYIVFGVMRGRQPPYWLLSLNPFSAMASALAPPPMLNQFGGGLPTRELLWLMSGGNVNSSAFNSRLTPTIPLWYYTVGLYAWLTLLLYGMSTQLVKPIRRFRLRVWIWLILVAVLGLMACAALWMFGL